MLHPLFHKRINFYVYLFIWILIAFAHYFVISRVYEVEFKIALIDSLVFSFLFYCIGFSLWYVVRFSNFEQRNSFILLLNHLVTAAITIGLWLLLGFFAVDMFSAGFDYLLFFKNSLPWRILSGFLFYITLVLMYYLFVYYLNFQEKVKNEGDLKALVKEAELNFLKSQLNPHFIFNSLNSISYLTMVSPEKAQEMIIKLSDFLRYSLNKDEHRLTTLREEINNLRLYMDIEKTRFGDRLKLTETIGEDCLDKQLPHMILQPIFENAIKYGVHQSTETVTIAVHASFHNALLQLKVFNNYDAEAVNRKGKGIGLQNVQNRLRLVYGGADLVKINQTDDLFEVNLFIPQNHEN